LQLKNFKVCRNASERRGSDDGEGVYRLRSSESVGLRPRDRKWAKPLTKSKKTVHSKAFRKKAKKTQRPVDKLSSLARRNLVLRGGGSSTRILEVKENNMEEKVGGDCQPPGWKRKGKTKQALFSESDSGRGQGEGGTKRKIGLAGVGSKRRGSPFLCVWGRGEDFKRSTIDGD